MLTTTLISLVVFFSSSCQAELRDEAGLQKPVQKSEKSVRPPYVAGSFYPSDSGQLKAQINGYLNLEKPIGIPGVHALLVPHAGLRYSAWVAASGFREIAPDFDSIILLGSNHSREASYRGISIAPYSHYSIGGVEIPISPLVNRIKEALPELVTYDPAAHTTHVLEIELPFLQAIKDWPENPDFDLIPMVLSGLSEPEIRKLAEVIKTVMTPKTRVVISSDLSHFEEDSRARQLDGMTLNAVLAAEVGRIQSQLCCGPDGIKTLLYLSGMMGWQANFLKYANSSDVTGDKSRVVGYGCIAFSDPIKFSDDQKKALLDYAWRVVEAAAIKEEAPVMSASELERFPIFRLRRGVFVTIDKNERLRGCIGNLISVEPLHQGILINGTNAALRDHRFTPLMKDELPSIRVSISVLTHPQQQQWKPEEFAEKLRPGIDGVILICNGKQSTYLPQVWDMISNPEQFLDQLALKQGSRADAWKNPGTVIYTYQATVVK